MNKKTAFIAAQKSPQNMGMPGASKGSNVLPAANNFQAGSG